MPHERHVAERLVHPVVARACEAGRLLAAVDGVGADLAHHLGQDLLRRPAAHRQPAAARTQLLVERVERVEHPRRPARGAEAAPEEHGIEDEQGQHAIVLAGGLGQRGQIVDAEVPAVPDDCCGHRRCLRVGGCLG